MQITLNIYIFWPSTSNCFYRFFYEPIPILILFIGKTAFGYINGLGIFFKSQKHLLYALRMQIPPEIGIYLIWIFVDAIIYAIMKIKIKKRDPTETLDEEQNNAPIPDTPSEETPDDKIDPNKKEASGIAAFVFNKKYNRKIK